MLGMFFEPRQRTIGGVKFIGFHLTQAKYSLSFYVKAKAEFYKFEGYLKRFALQRGFYEKYELMEKIGSGSFAKVPFMLTSSLPHPGLYRAEQGNGVILRCEGLRFLPVPGPYEDLQVPHQRAKHVAKARRNRLSIHHEIHWEL